jgi:ADP-ribose pyrophosphatase
MKLMNNDNKNFTILEKKILHQGFSDVVQYKVAHKLFSGDWSKPYFREICERYNAVTVLPYDPVLDKVVLIKQFRVGALEDKESPWLLELVAGIIDKEKTPAEIAKIETQEEAGLDIIKLIPVYGYWSSPGGTSEYVNLFCAIVDASNASGIHGLAAENENILVSTMSSAEAFAAIKSGLIRNASTIIALQWLELNKAVITNY